MKNVKFFIVPFCLLQSGIALMSFFGPLVGSTGIDAVLVINGFLLFLAGLGLTAKTIIKLID